MTLLKQICLAFFFALLLHIQSFASEEGTLTVITDPEGVEVWLGDKFLGDSPIKNKTLRIGRYSIKLIDPVQQVSTTEEILIQADQETVLEKALKTKFGTLKVTSDPEGANVYISTSLGKTPLENNFMNPGKYRIDIKDLKNKYEPITEEITIPQGKTVELTNTLVKTNKFDKKDGVRLILGAGAIAGFVWAIVEQGNHKQYSTYAEDLQKTSPNNQSEIDKYEDDSHSAAVRRTLGIIAGSLCVVAFEIVAFF